MARLKLSLWSWKTLRGVLFCLVILFMNAAAPCQEPSPVLWYENTKFSIHGGTAMSRTCLLIRADNSLYEEHETRNFRNEKASQAFQGTISNEERQQLIALLDNERLRNLPSAAEKPMPRVIKDLNVTAFIIPRDSGMQKVSVWESENASSKIKTLDPLITWTQQVKKKKFAPIAIAAINRCALSSLK